jgi:hypothetical protein
MAREAAFQQKKQDDCNARLNAVGSPVALADRCSVKSKVERTFE